MNLASASGAVNANPAFLPYLSSTVKESGFMSLYAGLSAGLLRQTCYATSRFGLFEVFRDELANYRPTDIWSRLSTGNLLKSWWSERLQNTFYSRWTPHYVCRIFNYCVPLPELITLDKPPTNLVNITLNPLLLGMVSGGIAALISCPAEVTLVRISNDNTLPVESRRNYKGVVDAFQRILKEEGREKGWPHLFRTALTFTYIMR